MKGIFKFRWVVLVVFGAWALVAFFYAMNLIRVPDFSFVHTFIAPSILLVVLAPTSIKAIANKRLFTPFWAVWTGVMVPFVNFVGEEVTGLGHHCASIFGIGGLVAFALVFATWIAEGYRKRNAESAPSTTVFAAPQSPLARLSSPWWL